MGKLIEKYKSENPNFSFELNELVQQIKSENNEENKDLFSTINSLREQLDQSIFEKNTAVQQAISDKNSEINDLKSSISELRNQLDKVKFDSINKDRDNGYLLNSNGEKYVIIHQYDRCNMMSEYLQNILLKDPIELY